MRLMLCVMLAVMVLVPGVVSADEASVVRDGVTITYDDEVFTEDQVLAALDLTGTPPVPPSEGNTETWVDPFPEPVANDPGDGRSVAALDAERFVDGIDWTGQAVWLWS